MKVLYFSSNKSGINVLTTTDMPLIGCQSDLDCVMDFITKNNEFNFTIGKDIESKLLFICERYVESMISTLKDKNMSIYQVNQRMSNSNLTCWANRYTINAPCEVINENVITDIYDYLMNMEAMGRLIIYKYPDKANCIPKDDQDLVDRAILQYRIYGDEVLNMIKQNHFHLIERVVQGIKSEVFMEYGI